MVTVFKIISDPDVEAGSLSTGWKSEADNSPNNPAQFLVYDLLSTPGVFAFIIHII